MSILKLVVRIKLDNTYIRSLSNDILNACSVLGVVGGAMGTLRFSGTGIQPACKQINI